MARYIHTVRRARGYGLTNFIGDVFMFCITGGLWLFWIIFREVTR